MDLQQEPEGAAVTVRPPGPYEARFPVVERRRWTEVLPGVVLSFRKHIGRLGDPNLAFNDKATVWTVISRCCQYEADWNALSDERYLLLGSTGALLWHRGELGWVQRIADPDGVRHDQAMLEQARKAELEVMLCDTALALAA